MVERSGHESLESNEWGQAKLFIVRVHFVCFVSFVVKDKIEENYERHELHEKEPLVSLESLPRESPTESAGAFPLPGDPVAPMLEVMVVGGVVFAFVFQPVFRGRHDGLLVFQRQLAQEDPCAEKHEVGVEHVAAAVVVDLLSSPASYLS